MSENVFQQLLLQIVLILAAARLCGRLLRLIGQPQVVGEMFAGILLGPSLLGQFAGGHLLHSLFPEESRRYLAVFAGLGVLLFMFLVGLELDLARLARQGKAVLRAGIGSMVVPLLLGGGLALGLRRWGYGPGEGGSELGFVLFMATALSITAFPVLARILTERNMHRSQTGMIAIACAAFNDIAGWCLLAIVFALSQSGGTLGQVVLHAGMTVGLAAAYLVAMMVLIRPVLGRLQALFDARGYLTADILAITFILLTLSSYITDKIGIHSLFGAFMLGAVMPSERKFVAHLTDKMEDIATLFLLPLFFAYTGLNTDLSLISKPEAWGVAAIITLVAAVGKVGGTLIAAGKTGLSFRHGLALGVLMNTRGLMELIILSLALSVHAIDARVFSMMVIMTLVTTMMTTPLLKLLYPKQERDTELIPVHAAPAGSQVLVSVARPERVAGLMKIGLMLLGRVPEGRLVALHIERSEEREYASPDRRVQDQPLKLAEVAASELAKEFPQAPAVQTLSVIGDRIADEILAVARRQKAGWIVLGWHKPILDHSVLGGTAGAVMRQAPHGVAVLVDKGLAAVHRVLVPYLGDPQDTGVLLAADLLARHPGVEVTILHLVSAERKNASPLGVAGMLDARKVGNVRLQVVESASPIDKVVEESHRYDLMVLGLSPTWRWGEGGAIGWLTAKQELVSQQSQCSLLIVRAEPTGSTPQGQMPAGNQGGR
jgi:Kef-type K+ transport system membrane component KefB